MYALIATVAILSLLVTPVNQTSTSNDKSCRQHPRLSGKCFIVHGRLSVFNGAPALRIWKIGSKRMLGVSEQRFDEPGYRNVPADLMQKVNQDVEIFGDYTVCPFTQSKPAVMQLVCIEDARNLEIKKRK